MTHQQATGRTIQEQFEAFHEANPHIYRALVQIGRELIERGHHKFNLETLWDRMRWLLIFERAAPVNEADVRYKLNDIYCSRYARLIMEREQDFAGMFETRRLRAA